MKDIKFAVIGGGFMGKAHSIALANYPMYVWPTEPGFTDNDARTYSLS